MNVPTIAFFFICWALTIECRPTPILSSILSNRGVGIPLEHQHHTYALDKMRPKYAGKYIGAGDVKNEMAPRKTPKWTIDDENKERMKNRMENLRKAYTKLNQLRQREAGDTQGWFYGTK